MLAYAVTLLLMATGNSITETPGDNANGIDMDNVAQVQFERNAALAYWRIFRVGDKTDGLLDLALDAFESLRMEGHEAMHPPGADPLRPGGPLDVALETAKPLLDELQEISAWPYCDFENRHEHGYEMTLAHVQPMRDYARVLMVDARRLVEAGRVEEGFSRMAGAFRMAGHLTHDGAAISAQLAMSTLRHAIEQTHLLLDREKLASPSEIMSILTRYQQPDPFGFVAAIALEANALVLLSSRFGGDDAGHAFVEALQAMGVRVEPIRAEPLRAMDAMALGADISRALTAYETLAKQWRTEASHRQIEDTILRVRSGEFGQSAALVLSGFDQYRRNEATTLQAVQALRQRLNPPG